MAIAEFTNSKFILTWRPFQLNPDMPKKGMCRKKYLETKFNGTESARKIYKSINDEGLVNNIYFQFDKIEITPNTMASHKLLALAHKLNKQTQVVESLFYDYFIEGVDIGKEEELIRIAKLHNIYDDKTLEYLKSEEDNLNLLAEERHARELGVKGVPCFIINKEFVLFGAQDKKKFINIFDQINNEH